MLSNKPHNHPLFYFLFYIIRLLFYTFSNPRTSLSQIVKERMLKEFICFITQEQLESFCFNPSESFCFNPSEVILL